MISVILMFIFLYHEPWDLLPKGLRWHLCCCEKISIMNLLKCCFIWYFAYIKAVWWVPCWSFYQLMVLYRIIILFFLFKQVSVRTCYLSTEGKPSGSVLFACKSLQQCLFTVLVTPCQKESCVNTKDHWICRPFQKTSGMHTSRG